MWKRFTAPNIKVKIVSSEGIDTYLNGGEKKVTKGD
jgi:hypothetical protein